MFESITSGLQSVFERLRRRGKLNEKNIHEGLREVRVALLQADVNFKVVKDFITRVTEKAMGREVIRSVQPAQQIVKIVHDELVRLMGEADPHIPFQQDRPTVLLMAGLQGSGKTTTCAKLAKHLQRKGHRPLLVAADVQRPAAIRQIRTLGASIDCPVYFEEKGRPPRICKRAIAHAEDHNLDCVILDTAGRLHIDSELMDELKSIAKRTDPQQIILVCDAMTGQDAVNSAKAFADALRLDGVILTKLDGDARGGAALSVRAVTGRPIKFVGVGEKITDLEEFYPDRMASRILGMGDVVTLVEKAQEVIDLKEAEKMREKLKKRSFDLQDFLDQFQRMKKMGPLKEVLGMIPGMAQMTGQIGEPDEGEFKKMEAILQSMTPEERSRPGIIKGSRRRRIARGSGTTVQDVNAVLKQFNDLQRMMKGLGKRGNPLSGLLGGRM